MWLVTPDLVNPKFTTFLRGTVKIVTTDNIKFFV